MRRSGVRSPSAPPKPVKWGFSTKDGGADTSADHAHATLIGRKPVIFDRLIAVEPRGKAVSKTISIFNNKGGVGKTTYMYHVAHLLAQSGLKVLMVDCDSQCNLTSYSMSDNDVRKSWRDDGNSIFQAIDPVYRTTGDIRN